MVAEPEVSPPGPWHDRMYVELAVSAGVVYLPEVARLPDQAPEAAHEVVLVEDQVRMLVPPGAIEPGFSVNVMAGAAVWLVLEDGLSAADAAE